MVNKRKPGQIKPSKVKRAFFAGYFDGEGCVYIGKKKPSGDQQSFVYGLMVSLSSTNPAILVELKHFYGGSIHRHNQRQENRKPAWKWQLSPRLADIFLKDILPFISIKKKEVELAIEFRKRISGPRETNTKLSDEELGERERYKQVLSDLKDITFSELH